MFFLVPAHLRHPVERAIKWIVVVFQDHHSTGHFRSLFGKLLENVHPIRSL